MNQFNKFRVKAANWMAPKPTGRMKTHSRTGRMTIQHKLEELLAGCIDYESQNPRDKMRISTLLIDNIPVLKRAARLQSAFIGPVVLNTEIQPLKDELEPWMNTVPIRNPKNLTYEYNHGMEQWKHQMVMTTLRKGLAFTEESYTEGENGPLDGLIIFDSNRFNTRTTTLGNEKFIYRKLNGMQVDVEPSRHFSILGFDFMPGSLWGLAMTDGGEFFGEILIHMLVALKNNYIRYGSPVGINLFTLKSDEGFAPDDYEEFVKRVDDIEEEFMKALNDSETGARSEIFGRLPGEVEYQHKTYGEGLRPMTGMAEDIDLLLRYLSTITGIPIELLGFDTGGDGFSGRKWDIVYQLLLSTTNFLRMMLRPIIVKILQNRLISINAPAAWFDEIERAVGFDGPDFTNEKEIAETAKLQQEALEILMRNVSVYFTSLGLGNLEGVREMLDRNGFEWLPLAKPSNDPIPEPVE